MLFYFNAPFHRTLLLIDYNEFILFITCAYYTMHNANAILLMNKTDVDVSDQRIISHVLKLCYKRLS